MNAIQKKNLTAYVNAIGVATSAQAVVNAIKAAVDQIEKVSLSAPALRVGDLVEYSYGNVAYTGVVRLDAKKCAEYGYKPEAGYEPHFGVQLSGFNAGGDLQRNLALGCKEGVFALESKLKFVGANGVSAVPVPTFKIGDLVKSKVSVGGAPVGAVGVIRTSDSTYGLGVEFAGLKTGHNLNGNLSAEAKNGWYYNLVNIAEYLSKDC